MAGGRWYATRAWLGSRLAERVTIETARGRIVSVSEDSDRPSDARTLPGVVLPGFANVHSHAFHRVLRGRGERVGEDFWGWREVMYRVAARLDPDSYHRLARVVFAEMALAGFTAVGEFHYLHHAPDGTPYRDPNAVAHAVVAAAEEAGLRITLLDTCYLRGGMDERPLEGAQRRFADADADAWAQRASAGAEDAAGSTVVWGAAIHSVRAVPPDALAVVAGWAADRAVPLHVHVSEQAAENEACLAATGRTPTRLLADHGALGQTTTAVHATHLTSADIGELGRTRTGVCVCPSTEAVLADGVGRASEMRDHGSPISLGTDCHAYIDPFAEMRALELHERLVTGRRGSHTPEQLIEAATATGMQRLGWHDAGRIEVGARADLVAVATDGLRLAGTGDDPLSGLVFSAQATDVTDVVIDGRRVVENGHHLAVPGVEEEMRKAIQAVVA